MPQQTKSPYQIAKENLSLIECVHLLNEKIMELPDVRATQVASIRLEECKMWLGKVYQDYSEAQKKEKKKNGKRKQN